MNRKAILIIIGAAVIAGVFSFGYSQRIKKEKLEPNNKNSAEVSEGDIEKTISENIAKYHPQTTDKENPNLDVFAKAAILVDADSGETIYAKNENLKLPPASIIKILTFTVALENFNENDLIEISPRASEQISNKINMKAGEKLKLSDLLYGLMMISANDAAYAIADAYPDGFDSFMEKMSEKLRILGLNNTVVKNPAGLDEEGQYSTVFDLATITRYTLLNHPELIEYAGKKDEHSVFQTEHNEPHWWGGHLSQMLYSYPYMIAAKTGYTDEAGTTYIGIAKKGDRRLIVVIMGSDGAHANNDVKGILDFGFGI